MCFLANEKMEFSASIKEMLNLNIYRREKETETSLRTTWNSVKVTWKPHHGLNEDNGSVMVPCIGYKAITPNAMIVFLMTFLVHYIIYGAAKSVNHHRNRGVLSLNHQSGMSNQPVSVQLRKEIKLFTCSNWQFLAWSDGGSQFYDRTKWNAKQSNAKFLIWKELTCVESYHY